MMILRKESPILFAEINNIDSAFYEEVANIPKHVRKYIDTHVNRGSGTKIDDMYYWSNTHGITSQKIFKRVKDGLKLEPYNHAELTKINEFETIEYVESVLGEDVLFSVYYDVNKFHPCITIRATHGISKDDLECKDETEFVKYSELFRGRHSYSVSISVTVECLDEDKDNYYYSSKKMTLRELKEEIEKFSIINKSINYFTMENMFFSCSSFCELEEVLTLTECAELCGKTEGAIRNAIKSGRFIEGVDWRKAGRITLITKKALEREYFDRK